MTAIQPANATAACPDGQPPRRGVPRPESAFRAITKAVVSTSATIVSFAGASASLSSRRELSSESSRLLDRLSDAPAKVTLVALVLTIAFVIALKAFSGRGTPLRGGWPSGHAAVAFAGWMAVTLILDDTDQRFLVSSLALIMALLVAQTRIEAGVHTTLEVAAGGALGALVTLVVFQGFSA